MNKVLVKLYVPMLDSEFDVWIPINQKVHKVIVLLVKGIKELSGGYYTPTKMPMLYDKIMAEPYDINLSVKRNNIQNGSEIILI